MQAKYDARNVGAQKTLLGQGAKLHVFPKDVMNAAFRSAMDVYGELNDTNPGWKKIYTDYAAFRKESNLWFSRAEASMDDFMQAQKL
jgi:TRAP-type mannitol/chloroaromatic compound transport system substrate-binding protein